MQVGPLPVQPIAPSDVKYIKLGRGGCWAEQSIEYGYVAFGYQAVPHAICLAENWEAVRRILAGRGSEGSKTAGVTEVATFYEAPRDCLWVTFAKGHLWWCFADEEVSWLGGGPEEQPSRVRATIDGWHNTDILGRPLAMTVLSSKLTQTANFRATICSISERGYLVRRINGEVEPVVGRAHAAREQMTGVAHDMIRGLHWADFETLADLVFARSGWQRTTAVGGKQADFDMVMEQPTTGETAFVQVKSRAGQAELDNYLERFRASGHDRFFFVCHSAKGGLVLPDEPRLHLFEGDRLADVAVKNGLFDWLVERSL